MTAATPEALLESYKIVRTELLALQSAREDAMRFAIIATAGAAAWLATAPIESVPQMAYAIPLLIATAFFLRMLSIRRNILLASVLSSRLEAELNLGNVGWQRFWNERSLKLPGRVLRFLTSSEAALWAILIGGSAVFLLFYVPVERLRALYSLAAHTP